MPKDKIKYQLDFIPLIILGISAIGMLWTAYNTNIVLQTRHYFGLVLLLITAALFLWHHQLGVLSSGITILLGLCNLLSYSAAVTYYSFGFSVEEHSSPQIKFQGIFLLWLVLHLILSGRYYVGIATKEYWRNFFMSIKKRNSTAT